MSEDVLGTRATSALLTGLRETVAAFAAREEKLVHDLTARRNSADRELREATETAGKRHRAHLAETGAYFRDEINRNEKRFERRTARIAKAYPNAKRQQRVRAEAHKGEGISAAQMGRYRADKERDEALAAAAEEAESLAAAAAAEEATLAKVQGAARLLFFGYWSHLRQLRGEGDTGGAGAPPEELVQLATSARNEAARHLGKYRRIFPARAFQFLPVPALALAAAALYAWLARGGTAPATAAAAGGVFVVLLVLHHLCRKAGAAEAAAAGAAVRRARSLLAAARDGAERRLARTNAETEAAHAAACAALDQRWSQAVEGAATETDQGSRKVEEQVVRVRAKAAEIHARRGAFLEAEGPVAVAGIDAERDAALDAARAKHARATGELEKLEAEGWAGLAADWDRRTREVYARLDAARPLVGGPFPGWARDAFAGWAPPTEFGPAVRFGELEVDVAKLAGRLPADPRLALPGPAVFTIPLAFAVPGDGALLVETGSAAAGPVAGVLNALVVRLLGSAPPGKVAFTFIDPVGLGENFAGVMHLADHEESLVGGKIWTAAGHIEERLAELNERIEKIIQRYLRDEFATIAEYNREAGAIAEKYHFLVVADFPSGFSDAAVRRLQSVATSGARCGVHALVHWDRRQALQDPAAADALRSSAAVVVGGKNGFHLAGCPESGVRLSIDPAPPPDLATAFFHRAGAAHIDADHVEVPFADIAPAPGDFWTGDATSELRVPIGRTGATKHQELALGKDTRQHALFAGKTGSGKSTLFHVIITNLALRYSPDEVEFYLVDFKKGVEFKSYATARLPHARVVAIESDREFGLSVLQRLDDELRRRGDLFRKAGVQDVAGYRRSPGAGPLPRTLLIIDEFQEYFVEDDRVAQGAAVLLDRIVRQGRAFGIHVLLGSQTLGGAFTLARATLGQMVVRVALQCNEADAYLIMDESNPAPRFLTRPGEGIYNDSAGAVEGNSPFQVVWLPEEVRERYLAEVSAKAAAEGGAPRPAPFVFEGNAPAEVRENAALAAALATPPTAPPAEALAWLGAPNAIKGPTAAALRRQSGNHLLVVGQREDAALAIVGVSMLGLAAQFPPATARFYLFDSSAPESQERQFLEKTCAAVPGGVTVVRNHNLEEALGALTADLATRSGDESAAAAPATFLFVSGLQHFKKLRPADEFGFSMDEDAAAKPSSQFSEIIAGGSSAGVHVVATVDTYGNVNRFLGRKALAEFEMRVLFQMGANDSASLADTPAAGSLGLHRALFYHEGEGYLETFRPYAIPDEGWLDEAAEQLRRHARAGVPHD